MAQYIHFTDKQKQRAAEVDLKNSYAREEKNSFLLDGIRGSIEIIA